MCLIDQLRSLSRSIPTRIARMLTGSESRSRDGLELVEGSIALDQERDGKAVLVMKVRDERAERLAIPGTDETVASYNPEYPADDRVIEVRFVESLDAYLNEWTATDVLEASADGTLDAGSSYSYPESRLELLSKHADATLAE